MDDKFSKLSNQNDNQTDTSGNFRSSAISDALTIQSVTQRVSMASRRSLARELDKFGLTIPQWTAMRALQQHTRPGCTLNELAEAANQVAATMTGIVDRLVERGLVERQRDTQDRRALRLYLTGAGQELITQVDALQCAQVLKVIEHFSDEERSDFIRLMQLYLNHLTSLSSEEIQTPGSAA